jgi:small-conductance mechanosensitive channel
VNRAIWRIFRIHGITIPVPQQDMRLLTARVTGVAAQPAPAAPPVGVDKAAD